MYLVVGVGYVDIVEVEQGNFVDVVVGQCFCCLGIDFVDVDYCDVVIGQVLQFFVIV